MLVKQPDMLPPIVCSTIEQDTLYQLSNGHVRFSKSVNTFQCTGTAPGLKGLFLLVPVKLEGVDPSPALVQTGNNNILT